MNDLTITCTDCHDDFHFTTDEQRFYAERGIRQPVRCGSCRAERRSERNAALIATYESNHEASSWADITNGAGYGLTGSATNRRDQRGGQRGAMQQYRAVCAACGKETEVPFQPRSGRPVYCRECFNSRRGQ